MDDRSKILVASVAGAAVGGILGCLYLTEPGRRVRSQIQPMLDLLIDELQRTQGTLEKAREATLEGRRTLGDLFKPTVPHEVGSPREGHSFRQASS